jgi:spermidine synthase
LASQATDPVELIDTADLPGGGQLLLLKCGTEFSIEFGREELMGSRDHLSEQALATLTSQRLTRTDGRVLVGGLGMGFTLGAALAAWGPKSTVIVAELVPQVVAWAKGPLAHIFGDSLADPRVSIKLADVHDVIAGADGYFDAILLDVDNGPDGFIQLANERLYCNWGLRSAYSALRPGGVLAVWSAYPDAGFGQRLEAAGFSMDEVSLPAFAGSKDKWHCIWFAAKPELEAVAVC